MPNADENSQTVWKEPSILWWSLIAALGVSAFIFYDGLSQMVYVWSYAEEYGYGFLIPILSLFLIWQKRTRLERIVFNGSWYAIIVVLSGVVLLFLGQLSAIPIIIQYSFLVTLTGIAYALVGSRGLREIWPALFFLIFMIPLPNFVYQNLSAQLQLISSALGVGLLRLLNISVYLEGNVIDLGTYKLQVVDACSGLRYLFPLAGLAFITSYFFKGPFWQRAVIFISSAPVTVFMNSFRIAVIGVLVDKWGTSMAEGFLHYFEGWIIFMACFAILFGEMWLFARVGSNRRSLGDLFSIELPSPRSKDAQVRYRNVPGSYWTALSLLVVSIIPTVMLGNRAEIHPTREVFAQFPMSVGEWEGKRETLENIYLESLKLDDYVMINFRNKVGDWLNFYVAYYDSQKSGVSAHSPRTCIPGGGWRIMELKQRTLDGIELHGVPLTVNRVVIQKGDNKQLVYYWFQERGRDLTNELIVKWYIFWDALTRNRTDGALVRLTTMMRPGEALSAGDQRLSAFAKLTVPELKPYIPD